MLQNLLCYLFLVGIGVFGVWLGWAIYQNSKPSKVGVIVIFMGLGVAFTGCFAVYKMNNLINELGIEATYQEHKRP